ncbi:phosphodiesterase (plasmid) [Brevundimonas staleyi]|uniref:Phosphodiesterase n=1 Tax=Brevundimonas staleyi TaxID=74326 RepID=A0ABW0FNW9_9CAUL
MLIAQISDFHVVPYGTLAYGRVDTRNMLARAVVALNRLQPQPDLVVLSGDLTQSGDPAEYDVLMAILAKLRAPVAPAAGNHDDRDAFRAAFPSVVATSAPSPFIQYVLGFESLRVIVLDTVTAGSDAPEFCDARAGWFAETLAASATPALVVTHHPLFMTGIPWMDPESLAWTDPIRRVVEAYPGRVTGFVCGHIHRAIHTQAFGVPASSCPSTAHLVALDFGAASPRLSMEAPGFQLHAWNGLGLTTYTASLERFGSDFSPGDPRL